MLEFNQKDIEINKPSRKKPIYPINTDLFADTLRGTATLYLHYPIKG
jgi:hypothetical protein